MSRVLLVTDAFPPVCGGSGWSTLELACGLRARGHDVVVARPRPGHAGTTTVAYDGFEVIEYGFGTTRLPVVRNYLQNERLWAGLAHRLAALVTSRAIDVLHAQHLLSAPAAVRAARRTGRPAVCTVRDYWPVCYWGTLIYDPEAPDLCPACTARQMCRCLRPRAGRAWLASLPAIPYMRGNLHRKQTALAGADAVVAVSRAIARDLADRGPALAGSRIEVVPNPVNLGNVEAAARNTRPPLPGHYAVFVGKLELNKGVQYLLPAIEAADLAWPVMVVGDGTQRGRLEADARRMRRDVRFTGWLPRDQALAYLAHASILVFPSYGPESLSRVLLEAAALRVPIAAMDTGGTSDIVTHERTGLLVSAPADLGVAVRRLAGDPALARSLADAARDLVARSFDTPHVAARIEAIYASLIHPREGRDA